MSNSWLIHCNNHLEFFYPPRAGNNPVQLVMCSLFAGHYIFKRKVSVLQIWYTFLLTFKRNLFDIFIYEKYVL